MIGDVSTAIDISEVHRFSLDEYHQLIDSGGFDEDMRVELIDGLIVEMSPRSPKHENVLARSGELLRSEALIGIELPLDKLFAAAGA